jgi:hypothetical protein
MVPYRTMSGMTAVPPEAGPARLTAILCAAGVLERGEVADVAVAVHDLGCLELLD